MGGQEPVKTEKYFSTGLLAHVDAGKTTLSEALLYLTGCLLYTSAVFPLEQITLLPDIMQGSNSCSWVRL